MSIIWPNVCFGQLSGQIPLQGEVSILVKDCRMSAPRALLDEMQQLVPG